MVAPTNDPAVRTGVAGTVIGTFIGPTVNPGIAGRGKIAGIPGVLAVTDRV
jgi:hypothetical protein